MAAEYEILPQRTLREIASRCGRGWRLRNERLPVAMTHREQLSRVENYRIASQLAFQYLRRGEHMDDLRDGIWNHVCAEVSLFLASIEQEATDGTRS